MHRPGGSGNSSLIVANRLVYILVAAHRREAQRATSFAIHITFTSKGQETHDKDKHWYALPIIDRVTRLAS